MSPSADQFVFMTCRPGAEAALKQEVARVEPAWRPSYSRPGFVTFKQPGERPLDDRQLAERHWVFAHACGVSLGRLSGTELGQLAADVWELEGVRALATGGELEDLHVWQREPAVIDDRGMESHVTPLAHEVAQAVRDAAPESCGKLRKQPAGSQRRSPRDSLVLDVVLVEPHEWWIGCHRALVPAARWPGGVIPVTMPDHAVSRAYAKMEEAIAWSGLPLAAGDECVEIGCAPGGASQALLDRGLFVTGIDPAEVDPAVAAHPRFRHLKKRGREVRRREFVGVRWLAADMNIAPRYTLDTVEAIVTHPEVSIRGLILTLKLANWTDAERLSEFAERVRSWGYRDVRMRQLATGGQEVCLVALRRRELRRLGGQLSRKRRTRSATAKREDGPHPSPAGPHF